MIHCYGQWWHGGHDKVEALCGVTLRRATHQTVKRLKQCYVFCGDASDRTAFEEFYHAFDVPLYGYREFEDLLKDPEFLAGFRLDPADL